jgi:hypothetical protein
MQQHKKPGYEYYAEIVPIAGATVDIAVISARLNELARDGWRLVCFTNTIAWFERVL